MEETIIRFGGGEGTAMHAAAAAFLVTAILLLFFLPRRYVFIPLLVAAIFIPLGQRVVIAGLNFTALRIMLLFAWMRLIGEIFLSHRITRTIELNTIDKLFICWVVSSVATFTLLYGAWGAFINRMAFLYETMGVYFFFRFLVRDYEDLDRIIKVLAVLSVLLALCMLNEQATGQNPFAVFGGVPEFNLERWGRIRSQGPFGHPITAGVFGATLLPLFVGLWQQGKRVRKVAFLGIVAATLMVVTSASSTPAMVYLAGIVGLCFWPLRRYMRLVCWGVVFSVVGLHIVMKAPVWALIARVDIIGGASGYHRSMLIDNFIRRFDEWWLLGTESTAHWGWLMADTANQYVDIGETGGLLTLILFLGILAWCFKGLGLARRMSSNRTTEFRFWALGAGLFAHAIAFLGISYWDQIIILWYGLLAMIASATLLPQAAAHSVSARPAYVAFNGREIVSSAKASGL